MKKLFAIFCLLYATHGFAQTFNNEWIDYTKTYYKFKVGKNGIYRIGQAVLQTNGLATTLAQNFQLWRNGTEIPIYTSVSTGVLGASDYIEFYGVKNDGKPDKALYRNATDQLNDRQSLETDTAAYFLTVNTTSNNARYVQQTNNVAGNALTAEPYFMYTEKYDFKEVISQGFADVNYPPEYIYSSSYEAGEMFTTHDFYPGDNTNYTRNFYPYTGSNIASTITVAAMGTAPNSRTVNIGLNGNVLGTMSLSNFESKSQQFANVPTSYILTGANQYQIRNLASNTTDRIDVNSIDINYPRLFNFDNQPSFEFELAAKATGQYVEIKNFNQGSAVPVLYDYTNYRRYTADVLNGIFRFLLPASTATTKYVLCSEDASQITSVSAVQQRTFTNYSTVANQGDYLIISNSILYTPINGSNPVDQFRAYRASIAGGSYNAKIVNIDQLEDQFAFGIKKHPLCIKNFLRFARQRFSTIPKFAFLIGKGVNYQEYYFNQSQAQADQLNLIPTFGAPASDVLLASDTYDPYPNTFIGRLSAVSGQEILDYLSKVMQYETTQSSTSQTQADKLWQKNVVHVLGADDVGLHSTLTSYFTGYTNIIKDTLYGGNVITLDKLAAGVATYIDNDYVNKLFSNGINFMTYFGHSSTTTLDFNLQDPTTYSNAGKYPMFLVFGCTAGNIYTYDVNRLSVLSTISEKYVSAKNLGSIGMLADTHFGLTGPIDNYLTGFYNSVDKKSYGKSVGQNIYDACSYIMSFNTNPATNFETRIHAEEHSLNGDPAIKIQNNSKPDYSIEQPNIIINPSFISASQSQFTVNATYYNLAKATNDSIRIQIKRQYPASSINPNGATELVYDKKVLSPKFMDSISISLPIITNRDIGTNTITITLDADNKVDELSELNNSASQNFVIYQNAVNPVYPYNFSIVNKSSFKFVASTSDPLVASTTYRLEMDTTELFNSPLKGSAQVTQIGGEVEFTPPITNLINNTVYYWRVAPVVNGTPTNYQTASFLYNLGGSYGWNQSHLYQHFKSTLFNISLDSTTRRFNYGKIPHSLVVNNAYYFGDGVNGGIQDYDFSTSVDGNPANIYGSCSSAAISFLVFDTLKFAPWSNPSGGLYGSNPNSCGAGKSYNFDFYYYEGPQDRKKIMDFMNLIPNGYYVVAKMLWPAVQFPQLADSSYASVWRKDTLIYGKGQSVPDYLYAQGFTTIDQLTSPRLWTFIYKKNDQAHFKPVSKFSANLSENISLTADCAGTDTTGTITSPIFGPAKQWQQVHWRGHPLETTAPYPDSVILQLIGIDKNGNSTVITQLDRTKQDFDISGINATTYPNIQLKLINADNVNATPWQLDSWRLDYVPVPEGALAPNIVLTTKDTLQTGEPLNFSIGFKNISDVKFSDSIKVKAIVTDKSNVQHVIPMSRRKDLAPGDTTTVGFQLITANYQGTNNIYLEVNPTDSAQLEQYHFNNFLYKSFFVKTSSNPLLDVTFDGIHILNRDIVSSKPHIQIKLKSENQYLALNDTGGVKLTLRYPDGTTRSYNFGTDTLRFTPATLINGDNTATIDFYPTLNQDSQNQNYELTVSGKDRTGNNAGATAYQIDFQVFNKPMISNMFNYPNPFTTSTAFVFTLTGSQIPQEFKIQILTITGKIVREITKAELGPLVIGRNITEFKWDGTDQYGSKLANGVYIYRVITGLNGKKLDQFKINDNNDQTAQDQTDQYFNKGYGKMYLMR